MSARLSPSPATEAGSSSSSIRAAASCTLKNSSRTRERRDRRAARPEEAARARGRRGGSKRSVHRHGHRREHARRSRSRRSHGWRLRRRPASGPTRRGPCPATPDRSRRPRARGIPRWRQPRIAGFASSCSRTTTRTPDSRSAFASVKPFGSNPVITAWSRSTKREPKNSSCSRKSMNSVRIAA